MKRNIDPKKIQEIIERGVETVFKKESLFKELKSGKKLRIKHGVDPTGPKIHIGRAAILWKLKEFQNLGHQVVLIVGDFTAQIGDASDKQDSRKALSQQEIKENMRSYTEQIGMVLDISKTEVRYNSEWLGKLTARDLLNLSMNFTVQQLIQRRNFKERWDQRKEIGLHELSYPLLQGYDSIAIKADVEIGGSDQLFNLLAGRKLQEAFGQKPQDILTLEMLYGLDGRKMSTSWGNIISLVDSPNEKYGKIMSMRDDLIINYFRLITKISEDEIKRIEKDLKGNKVNPRDLKEKLALELVATYHGKGVAIKAKEEFNRIFKEKKLPSKIPEVEIKEKTLNILDLLVRLKLSSSKSEARRLVEQKGVKINEKIQENQKEDIQIKKGMIVRVGKRKFAKIIN